MKILPFKTLVGDGYTSVSALLGGPAITTYGENTGVVDDYVRALPLFWAACIAMILALSILFKR